ncbi:3-hydroxyacyl-CoA dehydrogenase NAD-binding domain-containing protein [Oceanospirillum sp.]|uniref:3-hydroxyacyl-CoA dehydrogenase/enoyl-CoA hydratase family protein n=1 Tax=Oceanospirillum sp. TaxID=2021254 RepID=UPI003A9225C7
MAELQIRRVAVIGAGVMGAGIAAQAANAGAQVLLLDRPSEGDTFAERSRIAADALGRMIKDGSRGALMSSCVADRITVGNTEDHFSELAGQDWIVEAVVERLDVKRALYQRIDQVRSAHCMVSSNTSTLPLQHLLDGMSDGFRQHFVVTHFFNPPRYMRLVEFVSTDETSQEGLATLKAFNDKAMGKTVITCADRPGFIANRLGVYWMQVALQEAVSLGLNVQQADQVMQLCGFPKTGVFGLWDLCGIDLMPEVTASLSRLLPEDDAFQRYARSPELISTMIEKGWHGRKGKVLQGFYRQSINDQGLKQRHQLNLTTLEYQALSDTTDWPSLQLKKGDLSVLVQTDDKGGEYARRVLSRVIAYAASLLPDVAEDIDAIDTAMRLGYNWRFGPFELRDRIGVEIFDALLHEEQNRDPSAFAGTALWLQWAAEDHKPGYCQIDGVTHQLTLTEGYQSIHRAEGIVHWSDLTQGQLLIEGQLSRLWQVDNELLCFELSARINALSTTLLDELETALDRAMGDNKALLIASSGSVFAAGADLKEFVQLQENKGLEGYIRRGQELFQRIEASSVPVVAAVAGKALGGGVELLMHCHYVQLAAEAQLGLVEAQVGIVPGWGGCKKLLANSSQLLGADQAIEYCFSTLKSARVSYSGLEAKALGFVSERSAVSMNPDRLLGDAITATRSLIGKRRVAVDTDPLPLIPWQPDAPLADGSYQSTLEQALLSLLNSAGAEGWYNAFDQLELATDQDLAQHAACVARMKHLLETGKPLKN